MTESDWQCSENPTPMLDYILGSTYRGNVEVGGRRHPAEVTTKALPIVTNRKLLLFCYAWRMAADYPLSAECKEDTAPETVSQMYGGAARWARSLARLDTVGPETCAAIIREIFNPCLPNTLPKKILRSGPVYVGQYCPWLTRTVSSLAEAAYKSYKPNDPLDAQSLGVLSDALEDAGCTNAEVLQHLRGQEKWCPCYYAGQPSSDCDRCQGTGYTSKRFPCVRGCWVLDLLLEKK